MEDKENCRPAKSYVFSRNVVEVRTLKSSLHDFDVITDRQDLFDVQKDYPDGLPLDFCNDPWTSKNFVPCPNIVEIRFVSYETTLSKPSEDLFFRQNDIEGLRKRFFTKDPVTTFMPYLFCLVCDNSFAGNDKKNHLKGLYYHCISLYHRNRMSKYKEERNLAATKEIRIVFYCWLCAREIGSIGQLESHFHRHHQGDVPTERHTSHNICPNNSHTNLVPNQNIVEIQWHSDNWRDEVITADLFDKQGEIWELKFNMRFAGTLNFI